LVGGGGGGGPAAKRQTLNSGGVPSYLLPVEQPSPRDGGAASGGAAKPAAGGARAPLPYWKGRWSLTELKALRAFVDAERGALPFTVTPALSNTSTPARWKFWTSAACHVGTGRSPTSTASAWGLASKLAGNKEEEDDADDDDDEEEVEEEGSGDKDEALEEEVVEDDGDASDSEATELDEEPAAAGAGAPPAGARGTPSYLNGWSAPEVAALKALLAPLPKAPTAPRREREGGSASWRAIAEKVGTGRSACAAYDVYLLIVKEGVGGAGPGVSGGGAAEVAWRAAQTRFLAARAPPPWADTEAAALRELTRALPVVDSEPGDNGALASASAAAWGAIASALAARVKPLWGAPRTAGACFRRWKGRKTGATGGGR
jgi:hypothetical protein